jgi:glycosyltransferase involved in cell wall biosynthesis
LFVVLAHNDRTREIEPHYQLLLACPGRTEVREEKEIIKKLEPAPKTLPPIIVGSAPAISSSRLRLLVRMPTRNRPEQAVWVLEKYRRMAGTSIQIEVVVDEDDQTMQRAEVLQRLAALDCTITVGKHRSKVEACNGGRVSEWDILMLASDDMVPLQDGYARRVIEEMGKKWPHLDGALCFNDGHQRPDGSGVPLCTLPIFGRRLYEQFGYVYDPAYKSLFVDREQTDLLCEMNRIIYVDEQLIEHRHHIWGRADKDELYVRNDLLENEDRITYEKRKKTNREYAQWSFDSPPLWLSILICTVPKRRMQLEWLLRHLWMQIIQHSEPRKFEVLVDDRENVTVGEKRQTLLDRSRAHYIVFVDDDDGISHDYLERVIQAIENVADADCVAFEGVITSNGSNPQRFTHSIHYDGWFTKNGIHYRWPNHLSPVKRELALKVGFVSKNVGEDHEYSRRLRPLLKKEAPLGEPAIYYYWYNSIQSVQSK